MALFRLPARADVKRIVEIDCESIIANPYQPRKLFDTNKLDMLSESIATDGIIQPLTVRCVGEKYELICGERRLRAARQAGLEKVPCIIMDITQRKSALLALVENIQRADLNFFEEAQAIEELISFYGMTQEDAAKRLGIAQSTLANKIRLLKLSDEEKELVLKTSLTERHARALLRLPQGQLRLDVIDKAYKEALNVEKTEALILKILDEQKIAQSYKKRAVVFKDVRLFFNTINSAVKTMQSAGVNAKTRRLEKDGFTEFIITIPNG